MFLNLLGKEETELKRSKKEKKFKNLDFEFMLFRLRSLGEISYIAEASAAILDDSNSRSPTPECSLR